MTPSAPSPKFVTLPEIRRAAREKLPRDHWNFGDGAAETESSKRRNRRHLDRLAIQQNVLVDARTIDLTTSLLGVPLSWPVAVAPMGGLVLFHPETSRWRAAPVAATRCSG
jgi:isopentenyl diphosphate isomerase/L-lactate dehydrogenase-like FMN-dependent dehydrogenase